MIGSIKTKDMCGGSTPCSLVLEVGRHRDEVKEKVRRNGHVSVSLLCDANSFEHSKY